MQHDISGDIFLEQNNRRMEQIATEEFQSSVPGQSAILWMTLWMRTASLQKMQFLICSLVLVLVYL